MKRPLRTIGCRIYITLDQVYITSERFQEIYGQADKTGKIISSLIKYLRTK